MNEFRRICPNCGNTVATDAVFCISCGAKMDMLEKKDCSSCGAILKKRKCFLYKLW